MEVQHHADRQRFVIMTGRQESVLEYRLLPGGLINFTHTFVPQNLRGQGIAERLVRAGIAWAREQGLEIQASCWYVDRFIKRGRRNV